MATADRVIDGEASVVPPLGGPTTSTRGELFYALMRWQEATETSGLLLQSVFVRLPQARHLEPDIAWWGAADNQHYEPGALEEVPDLVVEVLFSRALE